MPKPIVVIGSINMDLVCRTPAIPRGGETILGSDFVTIPGGKGANQAVGAARLVSRGTRVYMVGRVGDDAFGRQLLAGLRENDVDTAHVAVTRKVASGVALITVDRHGENSIVVAPGANGKLSPGDVDAAEDLIQSAAVVVMQLETPLPTIRRAIALCRRHKVFTILDPAPAPAKPLPRAIFGVDLISPNETEARMLLGEATRGSIRRKPMDAKQTAGELLARGSRAVALKLGGKGSVYASRDGSIRHARPPKIRVVDTTAAGDAFTAGLAVARAEGMDLAESLAFANASGAACCTVFGAQPALPARSAVEALLR